MLPKSMVPSRTSSIAFSLPSTSTVTTKGERITTLSIAAVGDVVGVRLSGLTTSEPPASRDQVQLLSQLPELYVYQVLPVWSLRAMV